MLYFKQTHKDLSEWYTGFKRKAGNEDGLCSQDRIDEVKIKPLQISTQSVLFMAIDQCIAAKIELPPDVIEAKETFDLHENELHPIAGKFHKTRTALQEMLTT